MLHIHLTETEGLVTVADNVSWSQRLVRTCCFEANIEILLGMRNWQCKVIDNENKLMWIISYGFIFIYFPLDIYIPEITELKVAVFVTFQFSADSYFLMEWYIRRWKHELLSSSSSSYSFFFFFLFPFTLTFCVLQYFLKIFHIYKDIFEEAIENKHINISFVITLLKVVYEIDMKISYPSMERNSLVRLFHVTKIKNNSINRQRNESGTTPLRHRRRIKQTRKAR